MSDAISPGGDDNESQDRPHSDQLVSQTRVGDLLIQARHVGGNLTITTGRGLLAIAIVAVTAIVAVCIVAIYPSVYGRPKKLGQPPSQSPLSITRAITPVKVRPDSSPFNNFIFFKSAATLPPLPPNYLGDQQGVERWADGNGGVDADQSAIELVIQGNSAKSVTLTDLHIKVLSRVSPPRAISVNVYPGGDGVDGRWAQVDLDRQTPILEDLHDYSLSGDHPERPWSFPLRVSQKAVEVILLNVYTHKYDCQWIAELSYVADGKSAVASITDNGKPFRVASSVNSAPYKVSLSGRNIIPGLGYGSSG